jgi:Caspase domain/Sel1 repeat
MTLLKAMLARLSFVLGIICLTTFGLSIKPVLAQQVSVFEPRLALVIANTDYEAVIGRLRNPANDARLVAGALGRAGFASPNVRVVENQDQRQIKAELLAFASRLRAAGPNATGFLYFAGHGLQRNGTNYLLPVREPLTNGAALAIYAIGLDTDVIPTLREASKTLFVVIDACRDTPSAFRSSATRGLARPADTQGVVIAFSTAPGSVAIDGEGVNSPFAISLAEALLKPGLEAISLFRDVRRNVLARTGNRQMTFTTEGLADDFYFIPALIPAGGRIDIAKPVVPQAPVQTDPAAIELSFWQSAQSGNTIGDFQAYLIRYPVGGFSSLAINRLRALWPPKPTGASDFVNEQYSLAIRGDGAAMNYVGGAYRLGVGAVKDQTKAAPWFQSAAEAGNKSGMVNHANSLADGVGIAKNEVEAVRWYRAAANSGDFSGMTGLGVMLENGRGTTKNEVEAMRLFRAAANGGYSFGQFNLASALDRGIGTTRNPQEAMRWARSALTGSDEGLRKEAQTLIDKLTADGIR